MTEGKDVMALIAAGAKKVARPAAKVNYSTISSVHCLYNTDARLKSGRPYLVSTH